MIRPMYQHSSSQSVCQSACTARPLAQENNCRGAAHRGMRRLTDIVLMLGQVAFEDFEVPSGITFGGAQQLAVHRLVGGSRVIDALGRDDAQITFSGIFSGADATWRARTLDDLRATGTALPLTWDVFFYTVIISRFQADYRNGWWIPYRIGCTVLRDEAAALMPTAISLTNLLMDDVGIAGNLAAGAAIDLSHVQTACSVPGASMRGSAAYNVAQATLVEAQATLNSAVTGAEAAFVASDRWPVGSASQTASSLCAATNVAGQLSALTTARSYIARASVSMTHAST